MFSVDLTTQASSVARPAARPARKQAASPETTRFAATLPAAPAPSSGLMQAYAGVRFAGKTDTSSPDALIESLSAASMAQFQEAKSIMTFREFLEKVYEDPYRYLPTASSYSSRALKSFGARREEVLGKEMQVFDFQEAPWRSDALSVNHGIVGQEEVFAELLQALDDFTAQGGANRMLLLFGPKGTGKSEATNLIFEAIEHYSRNTAEGARYTFSWNFPKGGKGVPPFMPIGTRQEFEEWQAKFQEKSSGIKGKGVVLPSNSNCHPLFLLPKEQRAELIKTLKASGKIDPSDNFDYFINGDIEANSRIIFDNLLKQYDGNVSKVLDHIIVESWTMSRQANRGLVEIPAAASRDAILHQVTPDIDWSSLPEFVRRAGLMWLDGYLSSGNGGVVNYDDMGRDYDPTKYLALLKTAENGEASLGVQGRPISIREKLDIIFLASANPDAIVKMMKEGQWEPLKERIRFLPMGHIRRYKVEKALYRPYLETEISRGRKVDPYVLDALTLFMTMTRLLPPNGGYDGYRNLKDGDFDSALKKLDPLRKALLYQGEDINSFQFGDQARFSPKEIQRLQENLGLISGEYRHNVGRFPTDLFEGGEGLSVRDGQNYINSVIDLHPDQPITLLDVFEHLASVIKEEMPYHSRMTQMAQQDKRFPGASKPSNEMASMLRRVTGGDPPPSPFPQPAELLILTEQHMRRQVRHDMLATLGVLRTDADYALMLERYIVHAKAQLIDKGQVKEEEFRHPNKTTKDPNQAYMEEIEAMIAPNLRSAAEREAFRYDILSRMADFVPEKSRNENIAEVFSAEKQKMMAYDKNKAKSKLDQLVRQLLIYWQNPEELKKQMGLEDRVTELQRTIEALDAKGYPAEAVPAIVDWAFVEDDRYIANGTYKVRRNLKQS